MEDILSLLINLTTILPLFPLPSFALRLDMFTLHCIALHFRLIVYDTPVHIIRTSLLTGFNSNWKWGLRSAYFYSVCLHD